MSYILDALKKSEAERSRGVVPTLLTPPQTAFRSGIVAWILVAALIVNAGVFAAWMYWPRDVPATAVRAPEPTQIAAPSPVNPGTQRPPASVLADPPPPLETSVASPPVAEAPQTISATTPSRRSSDSSASSSAADVSFSTHVYATDSSMRAVTMDGRRYIEGDEIRPGVRIREITETGVILDVNGRPIPVDVLQDWR